eukprot:Em0599g5a
MIREESPLDTLDGRASLHFASLLSLVQGNSESNFTTASEEQPFFCCLKACGLSKHLATASRNAVATQGNTELCNYFLGKGSHWSEQDGEGRNCIHWALLSGAVECVSFLVSHKDIDGRALCRQKDIRGSTPLHYAAKQGVWSCWNSSLQGAPLAVPLHPSHQCQEDLSPTDALGWTLSSGRLYAAVPALSVTSSKPRFRSRLVSLCNLCMPRRAQGQTKCAGSWWNTEQRFGHAECVRLLLGLCAEVDCLTEELKTPLHIAALHGYTTILCQLLAAGASKDLTCPPNGER